MRGVFPLHYTIHLQFQDGLLLRRYRNYSGKR